MLRSLSIIIADDSSTEIPDVSIVISGFCGSSYGSLTPVKSRIFPARARLYKPLTSLSSQTLKGVET